MKCLRVLCVTFALILANAGCASDGAKSGEGARVAAPVVMPMDAAAEISRVDRRDLRVLDCRPAAEIESSRVKGARAVDASATVARLNKPETGPSHPEVWSAFFVQQGIGPETRVLIVDNGRLLQAAGMWYVMQRLGFEHASVVNGGYDALKAHLDPGLTDSGPVAPGVPRADAFVPVDRSLLVGSADKAEVLATVQAHDRKLLDARTLDEWRGIVTRDNPRVGHVPSAALLPHAYLFGTDGLLLSPPELRAKFEETGFAPSDEVTTYCQSGVRASLVALAMAYAGYRQVDVYFGSFGEWSRDQNCPIAGPE